MRLVAVALVVPLLVALPAPTATAAMAAATCQGQVATLVGDGATTVRGTEGPDVIVSNGSDVSAEGGADTICVGAASYDEVEIDAGPGDDVVLGGPGRDVVRYVQGDDLVDLGGGDDRVEVGVEARVTRGLSAGAGDDLLVAVLGPTSQQTATTLDLRARSLLLDGTSLVTGFAGFEAYGFSESLDLGTVRGTTTVIGTSAAERIYVDQVSGAEVRAGGGDDVVALGFQDGVVTGGPGRDRIEARGSSAGRFEIDLRTGRTRHQGRLTDVRFSGFEDAAATSPHATVVGNAGPNRLSVACGRLVGGGGNDRLVATTRRCGRSSLDGGRGHDVLVGGPGRDLLVGGPGRDRADGRALRDRCVAERRVRCES